MTTARERYEAKTKVVTFRVSGELYEELKKIKAESGLSFADLVKLGAGIASDEMAAKISEIGDLEGKLERLRQALQTERKLASEVLARERREQHEKLKQEIKIFRLFDLGWSIEEAGFKLGMSKVEVSRRFEEWAAVRGERKKIQDELLKKCLRRYIIMRDYILDTRCKSGRIGVWGDESC